MKRWNLWMIGAFVFGAILCSMGCDIDIASGHPASEYVVVETFGYGPCYYDCGGYSAGVYYYED